MKYKNVCKYYTVSVKSLKTIFINVLLHKIIQSYRLSLAKYTPCPANNEDKR